MSATFWIKCWGCNKTVSSGEYDDSDQYELKLNQFKKEGWLRREFGPNASPWFCGEECAYHSMNAKTAEEWWSKYKQEKKYEEYCDNAIIHPRYYGILGILFVAIIMFLLATLGSC